MMNVISTFQNAFENWKFCSYIFQQSLGYMYNILTFFIKDIKKFFGGKGGFLCRFFILLLEISMINHILSVISFIVHYSHDDRIHFPFLSFEMQLNIIKYSGWYH